MFEVGREARLDKIRINTVDGEMDLHPKDRIVLDTGRTPSRTGATVLRLERITRPTSQRRGDTRRFSADVVTYVIDGRTEPLRADADLLSFFLRRRYNGS
ncbi:MAG: hypothetical protein AAB573_02705 [Patescibacteria group bacterium]